MTKVNNAKQNTSENNNTLLLDTLAQLSTKPLQLNNNNKNPCKKLTKETLQKRAKSKAFTLSYLFDLIDLDGKLTKSYWQTYYCSSTILQEGRGLSSRYCNQRWCLTCNRIRTAKIINGYKKEIEEFKEPYFVTLTIPNVKRVDLRASIQNMNKSMSKINNNLKRRHNIKLKGLRKYECTYNHKRNDYHPHFHLIIDGEKEANLLVQMWLKQHKEADTKGQDISIANSNTMVELCKYFTKIISKDNDYNPKALNIMFLAAKGKRTFQPIGIKKDVSEEVEEIQKQEADFVEYETEIYGYDKETFDWVSGNGVLLSEYEPTKKELKFINGEYKTKQNEKRWQKQGRSTN